jgi:hypothetical protein
VPILLPLPECCRRCRCQIPKNEPVAGNRSQNKMSQLQVLLALIDNFERTLGKIGDREADRFALDASDAPDC